MDYIWLARHPYTPQAKNTIEQMNPVLTDELLLKAKDRLVYLLTRSPEKIEYVSEQQAKDDLILYPVMRLITSQMSYNNVRKVAALFSKIWVNELKKEGCDTAIRLLKLNVQKTSSYVMDVFDYLIDIPDGVEYKLVNLPVEDGKVYLTEDQLWDVIRKHMERMFIETLPKIKSPNPKVKKAAEEVVASFPVNINVKKVETIEDMAPCMKAIIEKLNRGENVSHMARWVIAVYLARIGWNEDQIVSIFSKTPNFNPRITQYHVRYIIEKKYAVPSCETLKSYGLCLNCGAKSPLSFHRKKKRMKDERKN